MVIYDQSGLINCSQLPSEGPESDYGCYDGRRTADTNILHRISEKLSFLVHI